MQVGVYVVGIVGALIVTWYLYQIGSRKTVSVKYKFRLIVTYLAVTFVAYGVLRAEHVQEIVAGVFSILAGCGVAYLVTPTPKQNRRIPKAVREAVIKRDLTSKGLEWNASKYHFDHFVPFSKGGDNSVRNLRIVPKEKNLAKGNKVPRIREFLQ